MWVQQYQFTIIAILLKSWLSKLFVWVSIRLSKCQVRVTWTFWFFEFTWTSLLILDFFKLLLDSTQLNYLNRTLINTYFNIEINQHYLKPNNYKPQNKPLYIYLWEEAGVEAQLQISVGGCMIMTLEVGLWYCWTVERI